MNDYSIYTPYNGLELVKKREGSHNGFYSTTTRTHYECLAFALKALHKETGLDIESAYSLETLSALAEKANGISSSDVSWEAVDHWQNRRNHSAT